MKFGKRLAEQLHQPWCEHYLCYEELKEILKRTSPEPHPSSSAIAAEGEFLSSLLTSLVKADAFFAEIEGSFVARLEALAAALANPEDWLTKAPHVDPQDVDLPQLVAAFEDGVHVPSAQKEALTRFVALCAEIDVLRKFSVLNSLAVVKITKKHDKLSPVKLSGTITDFLKLRSFYTSRRLAATFTHSQCIASEIITAATNVKPETVDYT